MKEELEFALKQAMLALQEVASCNNCESCKKMAETALIGIKSLMEGANKKP